MDAIELDGITKVFGDLRAVDGLSFSVREGELFGLLGPNGAGKTTLVNMLCTLLAPTEGTARVAGHDVRTETGAVREHIGVVFQEPALDEELTGEENLAFHARMYGLDRAARVERVDAVLALVDLTDQRDVPVRQYSGGMKRRLEIARGLVHRPDVLFLDEPTLGLDAQTRRATWEYIQRLNREAGVTVVLTTHYMEEADLLCDRVAVVDHGEVVALDTPRNLKDGLGGDRIALGVAGDVAAVRDRLAGIEWVRSVEDAPEADGLTRGADAVDPESVVANGNAEDPESRLVVVVEHGERRVAPLVTAVGEVATVTSVDLRKPSLEEVFLSLTGSTLRERETGDTREPAGGVAAPRSAAGGER